MSPQAVTRLGELGVLTVETLFKQANFLMLLFRLEGGGGEETRFSSNPGH